MAANTMDSGEECGILHTHTTSFQGEGLHVRVRFIKRPPKRSLTLI